MSVIAGLSGTIIPERGLSEVYLSSGVYEAMYKSRLCIEMRFLPRFSDQVFRNRVDNRLYQRDLYKGAPFCR